MPRYSVFTIALVTLTSLVVSTSSYPIVPHDTRSELVRRAPPTASGSVGSYAIMSPSANFLIYDNKFNSYLVYFKFGDTTRDDRDRAYSTHNPSVIFKGRKDTSEGLGKATEKNTLQKLVTELKEYGIVQSVGTTTIGQNRKSEWYEIYLGRSRKKAYAAKAELRRLLRLYGDETNPAGPHGGKSHEKYLEEFLSLFPPIKNEAKVGAAQGLAKATSRATKKPVIGKDARGPEQPNWWKIAKVEESDRAERA
ncbi:hypothetical protein C0993_001609 [Termitomyces sp. T159_Od127]|nr:hypothetical protein C0993_001609 [Termitomyces sp. T159_Od127]